MYFVLRQTSTGYFYFLIMTKNNEVLATSPNYHCKSCALHMLHLLKNEFSTPVPVIDQTKNNVSK